MKFRSDSDKLHLLTEVNRLDLIGKEIPESVIDEFIKKRKSFIGTLKDFRKSQTSKSSWRSNRYKMLKGIKKFHKSSRGKRFHRNLGRFLASRTIGENSCSSMYEALKSLYSMKTHLIVEMEYYYPPTEYLYLQSTVEEIFPVIDRVCNNLLSMQNEEILTEDLNLITTLIPVEDIACSISTVSGLDESKIPEIRAKVSESFDLTEQSEEFQYYPNIRELVIELQGS